MKRTVFALAALMLLLSIMPAALAEDDPVILTPDDGCPGFDTYVPHDWSPWTTVLEPTCSTKGIRYRVCNRCNTMEEEQIPTTEHHFVPEPNDSYPPTCLEPGQNVYICDVCWDADYYEEVPPLGHDWGDWIVDVEATCQSYGSRHRVCRRDSSHVEYERYLGDHVYGPWEVNEKGTCVERELLAHSCIYCGVVEWQYGNYGDHDWGEWTTVREATPEMPGLEERVCYYSSDHRETREIPYDGNEQAEDVIEVTLTAVQTSPQQSVYALGDVITYTVTLRNESTVPYINSFVNFQEGPAKEDGKGIYAHAKETWEFETVPVGFTWTQDCQHVVNEADVEAGWFRVFFNGGVRFDPEHWPNYPGVNPYGQPGETGLNTGMSLNGGDFFYKAQQETEVPGTVARRQPDLLLAVTFLDAEPLAFDAYGFTDYVRYALTVTNAGSAPCNAETVRVLLPDGYNYVDVGTNWIYPGESVIFHAGNQFSESELDTDGKLYIAFTVLGVWANGNAESNTVELIHPVLTEPAPWTPPDETTDEDVAILKEEASVSHDIAGYQEGETVNYIITVTNHSDYALDLTVWDPLYSGPNALEQFPGMQPGESHSAFLTYTVTAEDVANGYVSNTASVTWQDPVSGNEHSVPSNTVTVPATDRTNEEMYGVYVKITFLNPPANGSYYVLGEQLPIRIFWQNTGNQPLYKVRVHSKMALMKGKTNSLFFIDGATLAPGETGEFIYDYTVDESDVHFGYVYDYAYMDGRDTDDGSFNTYNNDDYLKAPAGSAPVNDSLPDPPTGKIEPPVKTDPPAEGRPVSCVTVLTAHGDGLTEYALTPCPDHGDALKRADELIEKAGSDQASLLEAWKQAQGIWQEELDEMYQKLLDAADDNAKAILQKEQANFSQFVKAQEALLNAAYPDQPMKAAQEIADMLMRQVSELCYAYGNAPAPRPDSLVTGIYSSVSASGSANAGCSFVTGRNEKGEVTFTLSLDADHAPAANNVDTMLGNVRTRAQIAEVFTKAQRAYQANLDGVINALYRAADQEMRQFIAQARQSFDGARQARQALLTILYPNNPEIVSEVLAQMTQQYAAFICQQFGGETQK